MSDELRGKIKYYFKTLRLKFEDFKQKHRVVGMLPTSLKEELNIQINHDLIHNVNFFQFSNVEFIARICRALKPKICIINEYVFHRDEIAAKMYFIYSGVCEVQAFDALKPLKFMTKGGYFGEIGVLLTGKRSCSVVVRTTSILQAIKKCDLEPILDAFPASRRYLQAVGKQRLAITTVEQIENYNESRLVQEMQMSLPLDENIFGSIAEQSNADEIESVDREFTKNMNKLRELHLQNESADHSKNENSTELLKLPTFAP